ncbi:FAD-binding oxidoreductase [Actinoallomurus bryophytorum]|uniref:FAD/FMN-containing dehydrogenase n=1 Tax=Actinoallomurus bryophytorum TaxID=1490222 RepID=A0A543CJZ5_9ACTN|nr:FAD-binding oxidoreductase [Actinoallomurus bryophytorum]TQL97217.1 FAD/FMN-containing dehydrogenase [Actinoallomurus bryophytorum]
MTDSSNVTAIHERLDGRLVLPGEAGYDEARSVWNAMVDRRPRMVVRCASVGDVVAAVRTARELDLELGVRCGGHSIVGLAVPEEGLMVDLRPMGGVRVDPVRRRAWVQGGALLGALDREVQRYGLATTAGNVSHTGVGGLTLGGGMGWLARQYGLTCDNVVSFTMVTADGDVVRASRTENPELFWGLRGGGGNFGIVTEFEFRLHPVGTRALVAEYTFPLDRALPALRAWRDLNARAPRQATFTASVGGDGLVRAGFVWVGDPGQGRLLLPEMRALGRPVSERVAEPSYLELQRVDDSVQGHTSRRYWKGHYLGGFPDAAIEAFLRRGVAAGDAGLPSVSLQAYGGAIADVPDQDAAFSHRNTLFEYVCAARWSEPAEDRTRMGAARRAAAELEPYATGAYVNVLSDEGAEGVRRAYPPGKLARLTVLKNAFDPHNVFHLNHNIRPGRA